MSDGHAMDLVARGSGIGYLLTSRVTAVGDFSTPSNGSPTRARSSDLMLPRELVVARRRDDLGAACEVARHGGRVVALGRFRAVALGRFRAVALGRFRAVALGRFRESVEGDIAPRQLLVLVEWESRADFESYRQEPALAGLQRHRERGTSAYVWQFFDQLDDLRPLLGP
jgi:hypothetical protein